MAKLVFCTLVAASGLFGDAAAASLRASLDVRQLSQATVEQVLLAELSSFGKSWQLGEFEEQLRPTFEALPKNARGKLEPAAVRYSLHRFFVATRGWYVKGLLPGSSAWNASASPAVVMQDRVPSYIQSIFEQRLHGEGLGLPELAAFAATIQDFVHAEALGVLKTVYEQLELPIDGSLSPKQRDQAVKMYMASYLFGSGEEAEALVRGNRNWETDAEAVYPAWQEVTMWVQDLQLALEHGRRARRPFAAAAPDAAELVEAIGHHFGSFQDQECRTLKTALLDMEYQSSGRVLVSDFYRKAMNNDWQFSESIDYLRTLGALDETDARRPAVVISNYLLSQSNCLASSSFYAVCCLDECEGLVGHLEREVRAPSAEPVQLAQLVAALPSDTVDAPRNLSASLLRRLEDIAALNGGRVPLHGRLFAQWMHHAYPRECPFPHETGTTTPMTPNEWLAARGGEGIATLEEMGRFANVTGANASAASAFGPEAEPLLLPWTEIEELVVGDLPLVQAASSWWRRGALLLALTGLAASTASHWKGAAVVHSEKLPRYNF